MKKFEKIDLGLKEAYEELFMNNEERKINRSPRVLDIEISQIDDFEDHPFKVKDDEDMDKLMESITTYGVLTPAIVREKKDGRYEMVSGHRRKRACERLGMETIPAVVKELSREEAIIAMTDSNIQRENILPSEKAWAYKMKMEAIKKTAGRPKKNSVPMGPNFSIDNLVEENNESASQIKRYIRLTNLIPDLLQMVDDGKIAFRPAVELSYLAEKEQYKLYEAIISEDCTPSLAQALVMKKMSSENNLESDKILEIMSQPKANQIEKIIFKRNELEKYFPASHTVGDIKAKVLLLLELDRKRKHSRDAR